MAIPEEQLDTWAHLGAIATSKDTYAIVRRALEAPGTAYAGKAFEIFLQGSYCNDTNVYAESDVDVVIRLDETYFYDISAVNTVQAASFNAAFVPATYFYSEFKNHVIAALRKSFGSDVSPGTKAVKIAASDSRRSADVVVAAQFQRHYSTPFISSTSIDYGICFLTPTWTRIVNYPKQHSANCTTKHQAAKLWFKPVVRIMKNMRNRLISNKVIEQGTAPSYFIEGMLYNVPNEKFGGSYADTIIAAHGWMRSLERDALSKLVCANNRHPLISENSPTSWPYADYDRFMKAIAALWNNWGGNPGT
jgi:hypothetical protein